MVVLNPPSAAPQRNGEMANQQQAPYVAAVSSVTFFPAPQSQPDFEISRLSRNPNEEPALTLIRQVYRGKKVPVELLQTSVPRGSGGNFFDDVTSQQNGFVRTVMDAYNQHRALIIRPDDVWLAILVQFNFFVNGNAELLREHFVNHAGKEKLVVSTAGDRYTADFAAMSRQMIKLQHFPKIMSSSEFYEHLVY